MIKQKCSVCSKDKPKTKEFFYLNGLSGLKKGLRKDCKICYKTKKDNKPKKKLDIHTGDMVYFSNDPTLEAGVGIVLSTEYRSFDIYDFRDLGISCFINQVGPASVPRICVLWVGENKSMWMDRQDIIVLDERIT